MTRPRLAGRTVLLILLAIGACDRPAPPPDPAVVTRRNTEDSIRSALNHPPPPFRRERPESHFVRDFYQPGLRRALGRLDDLEHHRANALPVAAFVRPLGDGDWLLWVMWLQSDKSAKWAELSDADGPLARFAVPLPDSPYLEYNTYLREETVTLRHVPEGADPGGVPFSPLVRTARPVGAGPMYLTIREDPPAGAGARVDVPDVGPPAPEPAAPGPATSRSVE